MTLPTGGILPSGLTATQLEAVTRRAFMRNLVVQIYQASPTLSWLFGNSQRSAGGFAPITIAVQGNSLVQGQYLGYGGAFNQPQLINGIIQAAFPTAVWGVPIPLPFGETVLQSTEMVFSLLEARMLDAWNTTTQTVSTALFTNNTSNPLAPNSFYDAFDDGTNVPTYGGISRSSSAFWEGQYINAANIGAGATQVSVHGFTRATMSQTILQILSGAGGELPDCIIMSIPDFATLANDVISSENVYVTPGSGAGNSNPDASVRSGYMNLNIASVPVFADPFCPTGEAFSPNSKYTYMMINDDMNFAFSGFQSLVPVNQIGQQGIVTLGYNTVCSKPVSGAHIYGIGNPAF